MKLLGQGNSKLKKTGKHLNARFVNFSIPAGNDKVTGKITCPFADECLKYCYAKKGFYRMGNVEKALHERYLATKRSTFVDQMVAEISNLRQDKQIYVRIHDSGDFYSPAYRDKWFAIAETLPTVRFYAYTKSHDMFRGVDIPSNFDVIFSTGSKLDSKLDLENEKHSLIFESQAELLEAGYHDCHEYDIPMKWVKQTNKIGLIKH